MELMDAAEKGEVNDREGDVCNIRQVAEVTRLLDNGELVDVGDLWTGNQ